MTVKDAMDEIKDVNEHAKFLYALANGEQNEHVKGYLNEAADTLYRYVEILEQMKVQRT